MMTEKISNLGFSQGRKTRKSEFWTDIGWMLISAI